MREQYIDRPLFLLTSARQDAVGIGAIFLRDLIAGADDIKVHWHSELPFLMGARLSRFGRVGSALSSILVRLRIWQSLRLLVFRSLLLKRRLYSIEGIIQNLKASKVVLTASSPELISLGRALGERGHDLRVVVLDAPEFLATNLRLGPTEIHRVMDDFDALMSHAHAVSVVSDDMRDRYHTLYGVPCEILRHGTADRSTVRQIGCDDALKIVFAGSLYCKQEWNAFVGALELSGWRLANRPVRLLFLGQFPLVGAIRPDRMEHHPHVPHANALEIMAGMDIGYLPYWLDPAHETAARTSFPGKMTAYAAAGLDVFHHGPDCSSVTKFLREYPFGLACDSLDPYVIKERLEQLSVLTGRASMLEARQRAMATQLSDSAMIAAFRRLLLVERKALIGKKDCAGGCQ